MLFSYIAAWLTTIALPLDAISEVLFCQTTVSWQAASLSLDRDFAKLGFVFIGLLIADAGNDFPLHIRRKMSRALAEAGFGAELGGDLGSRPSLKMRDPAPTI